MIIDYRIAVFFPPIYCCYFLNGFLEFDVFLFGQCVLGDLNNRRDLCEEPGRVICDEGAHIALVLHAFGNLLLLNECWVILKILSATTIAKVFSSKRLLLIVSGLPLCSSM